MTTTGYKNHGKIDSLVIRLDSHSTHNDTDRTFVPGQVVSGKLIYNLSRAKKPSSISLYFRGWCRTQVAKTGPFKRAREFNTEEVDLARLRVIKTSSVITLEAGTYEWPFEFRLPIRSTELRSSEHGDEKYNPNPQRLPPSFISSGSPWDMAEIAYELKAEIKAIDSSAVTVSVPLILVPRLIGPVPDIVTRSIDLGYQSWVSNKLRKTKRTLCERLRSKFMSDPALGVPAITLLPTLYMPKIASINQQLQILLTLENHAKGPEDPKNPKIVQDGGLLELEEITDIRVTTSTGSYNKELRAPIGKIRLPDDEVPLPFGEQDYVYIAEQLKVQDILADKNGILAPSFKSYTVSHKYEMLIKFDLRHVDTGHVFHFEKRVPFKVLPLEAPDMRSKRMSTIDKSVKVMKQVFEKQELGMVWGIGRFG